MLAGGERGSCGQSTGPLRVAHVLRRLAGMAVGQMAPGLPARGRRYAPPANSRWSRRADISAGKQRPSITVGLHGGLRVWSSGKWSPVSQPAAVSTLRCELHRRLSGRIVCSGARVKSTNSNVMHMTANHESNDRALKRCQQQAPLSHILTRRHLVPIKETPPWLAWPTDPASIGPAPTFVVSPARRFR